MLKCFMVFAGICKKMDEKSLKQFKIYSMKLEWA